MRQFFTIAANAFMELVRQPIFLLLMTASVLFELFLAVPYYFAFGDEPKLVENSTLAVMLLSGLFGAVLSASSSLAREIRTGTALAVLSKPVGRIKFLLGKFTGLAAALTVLTYVNAIGILIASRMAFDAYGKTDLPALGIFAAAIALAYLLGGFTNFFLRRTFVSDAVFAILLLSTLAAFVIFRFTTQMESLGTVGHVNWNLVPAAILILFALWILAAIALACSTRFDTIPTLAICSAIFLLGLMSDYFFGRPAAEGQWWASTLYSVIPNWQLFWLADAIETGKDTFQWAYVGKALAYAVFYAGAALAAGAALFEERELS
ncbi:MAG TPA: ABC transporter permease subunit [Pseudomonadales bacterium]|nr:ABC transporter permease subunit [Pseudomonadales bacterium]